MDRLDTDTPLPEPNASPALATGLSEESFSQGGSEELSARMEDMEQQFDLLRSECEAAAQLCHGASEQLAIAKDQLTEAQAHYRALEKEIKELRNEIALKRSGSESRPVNGTAPLAPPSLPAPSLDVRAAPAEPRQVSADLVRLQHSVTPKSFASRNFSESFAPAAVNTVAMREILETGPRSVNEMRRCLHGFVKNQAEAPLLTQLLQSLNKLSEQMLTANLAAVHTMTYALESLMDDLIKIPGQINPSTLRTVSQTLDFLAILLEESNLSRAKNPGLAHIFAVDDDRDARSIICAAMELLGLKAACAENPTNALAAIGSHRFDLIFIDVGLPEMTGFELCTRIRKLAEYQRTPIVFLTGAVTVQNRVQSSLSGGSDFVGKPFNLHELGLKALIWIIKGQLALH